MPPFELLLPFFAATAIFAITPGPGLLYMAAQTMAHGARAGWLSSVAFHLASYLHIFAAAFGLTLLLKTAPILLVLLKTGGGCYLVWKGIRLWKHTKTDQTSAHKLDTKPTRQAFRDSLTVEILNPKTALFYVAFLPQFTSLGATYPVWVQIIALGTIANVVFSLSDILFILLARLIAAQASALAHLSRWGRMLAGSILVAMGVQIIVETR